VFGFASGSAGNRSGAGVRYRRASHRCRVYRQDVHAENAGHQPSEPGDDLTPGILAYLAAAESRLRHLEALVDVLAARNLLSEHVEPGARQHLDQLKAQLREVGRNVRRTAGSA
jgi:hypothetical protein